MISGSLHYFLGSSSWHTKSFFRNDFEVPELLLKWFRSGGQWLLKWFQGMGSLCWKNEFKGWVGQTTPQSFQKWFWEGDQSNPQSVGVIENLYQNQPRSADLTTKYLLKSQIYVFHFSWNDKLYKHTTGNKKVTQLICSGAELLVLQASCSRRLWLEGKCWNTFEVNCWRRNHWNLVKFNLIGPKWNMGFDHNFAWCVAFVQMMLPKGMSIMSQ